MEIAVLKEAFEDLKRWNTDFMETYFHEIEVPCNVWGTKASCYFHCVNLDGNGRPRVEALIKYICKNLVQYAIPRKKILEAVDYYNTSGSEEKITGLAIEARDLFNNQIISGEWGELILFLLAERVLGLPQLICKMNLKTSTDMHYHGADGLHVWTSEKDWKLCLYWGESKLQSDMATSVRKCMSSIAPLLKGSGGTGWPGERDLQLLGGYLDVENDKLETALKNYLDPDNALFNKVEYRWICLVGFDSNKYPSGPNQTQIAEVRKEIKKDLESWKWAIERRTKEEKIDTFSMHIFMLPFPSVDKFREEFLKTLTK